MSRCYGRRPASTAAIRGCFIPAGGKNCGGSSLVRGDTISAVQDSVAGPPEARRAARPTIMIVDDDPEVRVIIAEFLADLGYHVLQAQGAAEALETLARTPDVRLVITDIRMPDMSGIELADIATRRRSGLKIILISGYFAAQPVERRYLRKPFRMKELEAAVRAELDA